MNTKYISDEFTNLNCLQTKGISISLIPKHATTNLVRFFIGTGANGKNNDSKYSRLFKNTAYDISQHKPLIVVTRNETERWCSGVVQELNAYGEVFEQKGIERILIFPMYPQFSCSTTGSIYDAVNQAAMGRRCPWFFSRKRSMPTLRFVPPYFNHPAYINALAQRFRESDAELTWNPDHSLITFHGIPNRYIKEGDPYRKQCEETASLLANKLNLKNTDWTLSFQSRFGKEPWLEPYTEEVLEQFGGKAIKKLITCCPGFTSDCLETIDEIGREGLEQFNKGGGEEFHLTPCLNDHPDWIQAMETIVKEETNGWI